jgi:thioredoxin-dependent peroxiredoxin
MAKVRAGGTTIRGTAIDVLGDELEVGQPAPDFSLVAPDLSEVTLRDSAGKVRLISVVPSIDTGVCAEETQRWERETRELGDDLVMITVSMDLPFAQRRWITLAGVTHRVLSSHHDEKFGQDWGLLIKAAPLRRLLQRAVFVVDAADTLCYVEYCANNDEPPNFEAALEAVARLT